MKPTDSSEIQNAVFQEHLLRVLNLQRGFMMNYLIADLHKAGRLSGCFQATASHDTIEHCTTTV